jgi:hypothetical protein
MRQSKFAETQRVMPRAEATPRFANNRAGGGHGRALGGERASDFSDRFRQHVLVE